MKKYLFALLAITLTALNVNAQHKWGGCNIEQTTTNSNGLIWEDENVKFTFYPTDLFWSVTIENKSSGKLTCLWDEVLFIINKKSSKIVFDDTVRLKKDDPKGESVIASETEIRKEIYPVDLWWDSSIGGAQYIFKKRLIKKYGEMNIKLVFPLVSESGKTDYEFTFRVYI